MPKLSDKTKKKVVRLTLCPSDQIVSSVEQPMKGEDLDGKHEKVICWFKYIQSQEMHFQAWVWIYRIVTQKIQPLKPNLNVHEHRKLLQSWTWI